MSAPKDLQTIVANFQAALEASSLKAAAKQCLADIAARDNPTEIAFDRLPEMPKPQPNVSITINLVGE